MQVIESWSDIKRLFLVLLITSRVIIPSYSFEEGDKGGFSVNKLKPSVAERLMLRARHFIAEAIQRAENLHSVQPDMSSKMKRFYQRFSQPGIPRAVKIDKNVAAWIIPLFDKDNLYGDMVIVGAENHNVLSVPVRVESSRKDKWNRENWDKTANIPVVLSSAFFDMPSGTLNALSDYLQSAEISENERVLGLPVNVEDPSVKMVKNYWIPVKNMHESSEAVKRINSRYKLEKPWKVIEGIRGTPYKCTYYAVATALDYISLRRNFDIGEYKSIFHGNIEKGTNPRMIEALYEHAASEDPEAFPFGPSLLFRDGVTGSRLSFGMEALLKLLSGELPDTVSDPQLEGLSYSVPNWMKGVFRGFSSVAVNDSSLSRIIDNDDIILVGFTHRHLGIPLYVSTHFAPVMGYYDLAGERYFVFREPYGDYPYNRSEDAFGGPSWRSFPASAIKEAWHIPAFHGSREQNGMNNDN